MALGPFARVLTQVVLTAGGAIGRAVANAYKEAAVRGAANPSALSHAISPRMSKDEAIKILEIRGEVTKQQIEERSTHMIQINQPSGEFLGSPFIQRKVENARTVLSEASPEK